MDNNTNQTRKEQVIGKVADYLLAGGYVTTESGANVVAEEIYHTIESDIITDEVAEQAAAVGSFASLDIG